MQSNRHLSSAILALSIVGLPLTACAQTTTQTPTGAHAGNASLIRTPIEQTEFSPLLPGVSAYFVYGGVGLGVPTAQVGRLEAGQSFAKHTHSGDYHAVVIAGRFQHWEDGEADRGPVLNPGSTFFQRAGVPHYDACLGPETCVVYVHFPVQSDFEFAPTE